MFYSKDDQEIDLTTFLSTYEKDYYIDSDSKIPRNKSSHFVENKIDCILNNGITSDDIIFIIAWKIGAINYSATNDSEIYRQNFDKNLEFISQFKVLDVSEFIGYIHLNFNELISLSDNPKILFEALFSNRPENFGSTYVITLLYFFTNGFMPIYDKYAEYALLANQNNILPNGTVDFKSITSNSVRAWEKYMEYSQMLLDVFGEEYRERKVDRSLWVYGHYFKSIR